MEKNTRLLFIEFKTATFHITQDTGAVRQAVRLKKQLTRADCNLSVGDHDYFNSDLFPQLLNGVYREIIGKKKYIYLDSLPDGVTVDTSKFLAVVRIQLNFRGTR